MDGHRALFTLGNIRDDVDPSRVYFDDFVIIFSVARVGRNRWRNVGDWNLLSNLPV